MSHVDVQLLGISPVIGEQKDEPIGLDLLVLNHRRMA
jgi:hypothetical protein